MILSEGRDDIGTDPALDELPPSPQEPPPGVINAATRGGRTLAAGIVRWFTQRMPSGAQSPTWVNHLEDWANRQLANISAGVDAARHKEISRLMHLLETDPDRGLRYSLPMGGDAHRGLAPPGGRLGERNVDFSLGRLGGGGPADFWDLPANYHYQLVARYRELANRGNPLGQASPRGVYLC